jgi:hypothetical protein
MVARTSAPEPLILSAMFCKVSVAATLTLIDLLLAPGVKVLFDQLPMSMVNVPLPTVALAELSEVLVTIDCAAASEETVTL